MVITINTKKTPREFTINTETPVPIEEIEREIKGIVLSIDGKVDIRKGTMVPPGATMTFSSDYLDNLIDEYFKTLPGYG